jgi:hypothetical protein
LINIIIEFILFYITLFKDDIFMIILVAHLIFLISFN